MRTPDVLDTAQELTQSYIDMQIAKVTAKANAIPAPELYCTGPECGEFIEPARKAAVPSTTLCITCANRKEHKNA